MRNDYIRVLLTTIVATFAIVPSTGLAQYCENQFGEQIECESATAESAAKSEGIPVIKAFSISPSQFYKYEELTIRLDYCGAADGLEGNVQLHYQGSLVTQSRNESRWYELFDSAKPCGIFTKKFAPLPTDAGPFDITYSIRISSNGKRSRWADATVAYLGVKSASSSTSSVVVPGSGEVSSFAKELVKGSTWVGSWYYAPAGVRGGVDIVFTLKDGKLSAAITRGTNARWNFTGPVTELAVDPTNKKVTFVASSGAPYDLTLNDKGELEGRGGTAEVEFEPTVKAKN